MFLIFFVVSNSSSAKELSTHDIFDEGNNLYKEGNYSEAIDMYNKILSQGFQNGEIFYNLANAYFRNGSIGYSILYYEKARRFLPRDSELKENLYFAKTFAQDKIQEKKPSFLYFILLSLLNKFTLKEIISLVSIFLSITLLICICFLRKKQLTLWRNLSISFVLILVFLLFLMSLKVKNSTKKTAVMLSQVADIKSAPSKDATVEFSLHEGTEFLIIESVKDWAKIRLLDAKTGWTEERNFGRI